MPCLDRPIVSITLLAVICLIALAAGIVMLVCGYVYHLTSVLIVGVIISILSIIGFFMGEMVWLDVYLTEKPSPPRSHNII